MNSTVKVAVLIVVIVACFGFILFRSFGGKKGGAGGAEVNSEKDMYCLECKKAYKATIDESTFMPLQMGGVNANPKHTCPTCSKAAGVAAIKCGSCGQLVPNPGMQAMMMPAGGGRPQGANCPLCKKPLAAVAHP